MALFKFRKGGDEPLASAPQPESIEAVRRRARHRLIGAVVLVLVAVVGFPLLFDTQPRPISVDIPIEIPDRNKAKPLPITAVPAVQAPVVTGQVTPAPESAPVVAESAASRPEPKPEPKPAKVEPTPAPARVPDDGAKAQALLEGKAAEEAAASAASAAAEGRFVVQVGAYADPALAQETRRKVEKAGLKTYTHIAETKEGRRIRVRVGPFSTRAEADKAAEKVKGLDLPAAVLTL